MLFYHILKANKTILYNSQHNIVKQNASLVPAIIINFFLKKQRIENDFYIK